MAKENTPGTAVAATDYITITTDPKAMDTYKKLDDKSFRGSAVETYAKIPAMRTGELSLDGNVNPATIGYFLGSLLPDLTSAATAAPTGLTGTASSGGTFTAATYYWKVTALFGTGETAGSSEFSLAVTASQKVALTWTTSAGASGYNVYRGTSAGAENVLVGTVGPVGAFTDTGAAGTAATVPGSSSAPATAHTFSCKNNADGQPISFTFSDFDGDNTRAFAGSKVGELQFKFSADGLLTFTTKVSSWASVVLSTPTPSYSTVLPIAAYTGQFMVNGAKVATIQSADISLKRKVEFLQTVQGTQDPYALFSGALAVSGKFTSVLLASDPILAKIGNSSASGSADVYALAFSAGNNTIVFQMSNVVYDKDHPTRGKDYVELSAEFTCVGNITDAGATGGYSPCKVFLGNGVASGTYQ
ncbi:phage tail tube protein [Nocardia sp. NPDC058058]|uniref:phage tail tube protein n=1 Tax=Nocardia sp. NPDC058058 TaxID=3346317 RepID=UPI0036DCEA89